MLPFLLKDKFPSVKISDIPGLETDGTLGTSANFLLFMMSLVFGMVWITYITFFNSRFTNLNKGITVRGLNVNYVFSRLVARFVTKIANRFVGGNGGYFKGHYLDDVCKCCTPSPPCPNLQPIHTIEFTQPPSFHPLFRVPLPAL